MHATTHSMVRARRAQLLRAELVRTCLVIEGVVLRMDR